MSSASEDVIQLHCQLLTSYDGWHETIPTG